MKFSCDRCDAQYMISDEKVGPKGVRVRCKKCGNVISVRRPLENGAAAEERPTPAAAASPGGATATQGNLDAELGQAFDHAFGGEAATTPAVPAPVSAAAEAAKADAAVPEPGALQLPAGDELPAFAAQPARTPPPAAPPATEWYVAIGQAQVGPLPLEEVRRKWEGADVGPDSLVWRPGMGDWAPLSSVADLAAYLSPFPVAARQSRTPAPPPSAYQAASASPAATPVPGGEVVWKPVGASALAALASEEIANRTTPEPRAEPRGAVNGGPARSLVEKMQLPDGGGVDPTGAIPLPMRALETTGEHKMERISSVARGAEEIRHRRSATRGIAIAVVALLLVGGAAAAWLLKGRVLSELVPAAPVASAPLPPAPVPEPTPARPAEPAVAAPAAAPAPATADAAKPEAAKPEAAQPEAPKPAEAPAVAAAPAQAAPAAEAAAPAAEPARAAPAPTTRASRREALRKERLAQAAAAKEAASRSAAAAAPAPAPEQPKRRRDVLDFESNDAALEAALGTSKPAGSRSVYVPPPPSGTALQERVTDSQVNETILGRVSALQQCVQEQKARDANGTGVLKMRWVIAPDGSVRDPKCVTPEFASSPIAQCLSGVLKGTRFPRSKMGRQDVTFPIKF